MKGRLLEFFAGSQILLPLWVGPIPVAVFAPVSGEDILLPFLCVFVSFLTPECYDIFGILLPLRSFGRIGSSQ